MDKFNLIAYLLWLIGGWVGLHHFYMGRDRQGVLWLTSFGGLFGLGKQSVPFVVYRTQCYCRSSPLVTSSFELQGCSLVVSYVAWKGKKKRGRDFN